MWVVLAVTGITAVVVFGLGTYAIIRFSRSNWGRIQAVDPGSMRFNPWPGRTSPERLPGADMYPTDPEKD